MANVFERIMKKVDKRGPDECWPWTGKIYKGEVYPRVYAGPGLRPVRPHEVLVERGEGRVVRHTCSNKMCCNPAHLIRGTYSENIRDAYRVGERTGRGPTRKAL